MFELPEMDNVEEIIINSDVVENGSKPISVHAERLEEIETSA
jgi:ATP-dependent Clp protease ATP-binding subunit ClpX